MADSRKQDTWGKTLRKVATSWVAAEALVRLVPSGVGFLVNLTGVPGLEIATGMLSGRAIEYMLKRFTHIYEQGEIRLSEVFGRKIPRKTYDGVGHFWLNVERDIEAGDLEPGDLVKVVGLLSPYGPLMPAHPLSRPGFTIEGWEAMGDLAADDTEEYDLRDCFIYGDRVMRFAQPRHGKYFAGLYDFCYGVSNTSIALYVDQTAVGAKRSYLLDLWKREMAGGVVATVWARLVKTKNFYEQFKNQLPAENCCRPTFGLEVFEIEPLDVRGAVHMSVSVAWERRPGEGMLANYFDVMDRRQFIMAEALLEEEREDHSQTLLFNYDDVACVSNTWRFGSPEYNEMLRPWLEGGEVD